MASHITNSGRPQGRRDAGKAEHWRSPTPQAVEQPAIACLSAEILAQIFQLYIDASCGIHFSYGQSHPNPHAILALVCRFWKDVLYECKLLWRDVDLTQEQSTLFLENARGAPLRISWDISSFYRVREDVTPSTFPVGVLESLKDSIEVLTITDSQTMLSTLDGADLPTLREFDFQDHPPYRGQIVEALQHFVLRAPLLTRLALRYVHITAHCLREMLQGCSTLEQLELANVRVEQDTSLARGSISLPHLQSLVSDISGPATLSVLCAIRDMPQRSTIRIRLDTEEFKMVWSSPEFQNRFCPFDFARVVFAHSTLTYVEDPQPTSSRPSLIVSTHLGYLLPVSWAAFRDNQLIEAPLLRSSVLNLLQLHDEISLPAQSQRFVPIAQLPPFRVIEVRDSPASSLFSWLRQHSSNDRVRLLECLVCEGMHFKTMDPAVPTVRQTLSDREYRKWMEQYQALTDLEGILRERHEGGSPIKLVLRGGTYETDVVERFRPFARKLEFDAAFILPSDPGGDRLGGSAWGARART